VERALANLRAAGVLGDARAMLEAPAGRLESWIRPAGTFRVKARRLRALLRWIVERGDGDPAAALRGDTATLRRDLLAVHGVGRETADGLLLYAAGRPVFVVDAYARRVAGRHGWTDPEGDYDAIRRWFEERVPREAPLLNQLHAEIVTVGKEHCRPSPRCGGCPLEDLLPPGGPPRGAAATRGRGGAARSASGARRSGSRGGGRPRGR
jgi:endonuclease-3 related protein